MEKSTQCYLTSSYELLIESFFSYDTTSAQINDIDVIYTKYFIIDFPTRSLGIENWSHTLKIGLQIL